MLAHIEKVDLEKAIKADPLKMCCNLKKLLILFSLIATVMFSVALIWGDAAHAWAVFHTNVIFFMGLSAGGVIISAILQIVRARWAVQFRRFAEANVAFLPIAYTLLLLTYFGKNYLFPWGTAPMPGREWWMQPNFVYTRFALLFGLLFWMMWRYVKMSLRGDIALLQKKLPEDSRWTEWFHDSIAKDWKGDEEALELQRKLSWNGPLLVLVYAIVFTLFSFEMIKSMDKMWISNLFGGFIFIGNIYIAWAMIGITTAYYAKRNPQYQSTLTKQQYWDLGKLTFGFCMLWGYFFFSQFLPQWYGNLPEETQWLILRTREMPWKGLGWIVFASCFIIPFITLISDDLKRTTKTFVPVCVLIFLGVWLERYMLVMPQVSPKVIPFGFLEISMFLGFFSLYGLAVQKFLSVFPFIPLSHPVARGSVEW